MYDLFMVFKCMPSWYTQWHAFKGWNKISHIHHLPGISRKPLRDQLLWPFRVSTHTSKDQNAKS